MSHTSRFSSRFFIITLVLLTAVTLGVVRYRSHAQVFTFNQVTVVSAASFEETAIAPDSIAVAFTGNPAVSAASATSTPLPTILGGVTVRLRDSASITRDCGLFFVSAQQINFLVPSVTAPGSATLTISHVSGTAITGTVQIAPVSPGIFSANASGQGAAIGFLLSVPQQGGQSYEPLAQFDQQRRQFVTRPILLDRQTIQAERLFFVFYATGIRGRSDQSTVTAGIGGIRVPVSFAGAIPNLFGLDQVNIPIEASLIRQLTGRGRVNVTLTISDQRTGAVTSNVVEIEVADRPALNPSVITGIEPSRALAGDTVTITGSGFLPAIGANRVRVGGIEAQVIEATAAQLKVQVPFGAETGPVTVSAGQGEAASRQPLTIRTSISGFVEDTRRRPIIGVTVRAYTLVTNNPTPQPIVSARTNGEGVFILPDIPTDVAVYIDIDASTASVTPRLPLLGLTPTVAPGRDNQLARPVTLQIPTGPGIKITPPGQLLEFSLEVPPFTESFRHDWLGVGDRAAAADANDPSQSQQQICLAAPGPITFELPSNSLGSIPCDSIEDCLDPTRTLYVTQIENSRAPVRLPTGHFSSTMVQLAPYRSYFSPGGTLTMSNRDCLASGSARVFKLRTYPSVVGTIGGGIFSSLPGEFFDIGPATVSSDGQRITTAAGLVNEGGIYFVSAKRPMATISGRVLAPEALGFEGSTALIPVRRAIVTARGQEAMTDGNGSFTLRNIPVLRLGDVVGVEVSFLRPNGRVERALEPNIPITANGTTTIGDIELTASTANRPPVIIASASVTAEENKRTDFNFTVSDADPNQILQVSMGGPSFASLINRGGGGYTLRVTPGFDNAGSYGVIITATDNFGATAMHLIALSVANINQPPTALAQSVVTDEDKVKQITLTGSDPDRNALRYSIVTQTMHGKLTGEAPDLSYTPEANYFGSDSFTFKVSDGVVESSPSTVSITINSVNDAPRLNVPVEQKIAAGQELKFAIAASDADAGETISITATDLPAGATLNQIPVNPGFAAQFNWTPTEGQAGTYIVSLRATDNGTPQRSVVRPLAISVTQPNAPSNAAIWTPTSGPSGGAISMVFASGSTLLASSPLGGVFRSADGGENWSPVGGKVFGGSPVGAFARVGSTLLASTGISIFRSTDNGATWAVANLGLTGPVAVFLPLAASFAVKDSLVFATVIGRVYVSSDNGLSWTPASNGLPTAGVVTTLTTSGSSIFASGDGSGVYRTDDDGKNWAAANQGLPSGGRMDRLVANAGTVYAILSLIFTVPPQPNVYASTDNGRNWSRVSLPPEINAINAMVFTSSQWIVSAATFGLSSTSPPKVYNLVRQPNGMITATPLFENQFISTLAASDTAIFVGTSLEGLYRSTDKGGSWKQINSGLSAMSVYALHPVGSRLFAATSAGVHVSEDQGKTWQAANDGFEKYGLIFTGVRGGIGLFISPLEVTTVASVTASEKTYLFAAQSSSRLYRSLDFGKKWEPVEGLPSFFSVSALGVSGSTIFAGTNVRGLSSPEPTNVYRSTDQGKSWVPAGRGLPPSGPTAFASIGSNVFVAVEDRVFVSSNNGESWSAASSGLPEKISLTTLTASGSNLYAGTFGKGVYVSTNNGQNWTAINSTLPQDAVVTALFANGSNLFVVSPTEYDALCPRGGVLIDGRCYGVLNPGVSPPGPIFGSLLGVGSGTLYFSPNQGRSWAPVTSGLNETRVTALGANSPNVFVGTIGSGVFVRQF